MKSANGVFVNGKRVETVVIVDGLGATLGVDGPCVTLEVDQRDRPASKAGSRPGSQAATIEKSTSETQVLKNYAERYFGSGKSEGPVGGRTMMIRRAFESVQKKQRRRHTWVVALVAAAGLAAAGYAYYKHRQVNQQQLMAEQLFYQIKSLDMVLADGERRLATSGNASDKELVNTYLTRRRQMERN